MSSAWVGALQKGRIDNWRICKTQEKWGAGAYTSRGVQRGDELFIWQSGSGGGWLARCIVETDAAPPSPVNPAPWTDGAKYRYVFGIALIEELPAPRSMSSTGGVQDITGILNVQLGQFPKLDEHQADAVRSFFTAAPPALQIRPKIGAVEPETGWGKSQDRERNRRIEQAGISWAIAHLESMGWKLLHDRQLDGVGYDLDFMSPGGPRKVEVKGIGGTDLAFNLTASEYELSRSDRSWLLVAVTGALGKPSVRLIEPGELHGFSIAPTQYRVRWP